MSGRSAQDIVMERCLALLTRLLRGAAQSDELIAVIRGFGDQLETPTEKAIQRRFEEDRDRLREWFGCELEYDRKTNVWRIESIQNPPFDLPDDAIRGLAFLQTTFGGRNVPMSEEVLALFNAIIQGIPEERRKELRKQRGLIELNLEQRDSDKISNEVMEKIKQACMEHRTIEFDYHANRQDGATVVHNVQPYRYFFEDGHYYLEAYCLETRSINGRFSQDKMWRYRMGRISKMRLLPNVFVPKQHIKTNELIYELSPEVARLGVTEHFPNSVIEMHEDGSATVRAYSTTLFFDLRRLLHYGPGCRVIGDEEAVREMKVIIGLMYQQYHSSENSI